MTPTPVFVGAADALEAAMLTMLVCHARHLPVCEAGEVVGILSQRDIYSTQANRAEVGALRVADAMSSFVYVVRPDVAVEQVTRDLADAKYGAAIVVQGERPIGVFTTTDAMRVLSDILADLRDAASACPHG